MYRCLINFYYFTQNILPLPSTIQFLLQVEKVESVLNGELSKAKVKYDEFKEIIEATETRFFQRGYIPYLIYQIQRKVSTEVKKIVFGKVTTEYDCLLFMANHFIREDTSLPADKIIFFCHKYKDRIQSPPSDNEIRDILYLKETISFTSGKRPSDYVPGIQKGLREELEFFRENAGQKYIPGYESQVRRFEDSEYLESLILKIQLQK